MSDQDHERDDVRQRIRALRHDYEMAQREYELETGIKNPSPPTVMADVVTALRATGNGSLADRFSAAFTRAQDAIVNLDALHRDGVIDEHGRDVMTDAGEDLERMLADATACLDDGGAP